MLVYWIMNLVDIDECYSPDACEPDHACNNTAGSYTCECPLGYIADPAGSQNPKAVVCVGEKDNI